MTNLAKRPPLGLKKPKNKKSISFLRWLREQPCCVCKRFGEVQRSATQAHHPIHDRFSTRKTADQAAIPLCEGHHQGLLDKSKSFALHQNPQGWRDMYGPDWSYSQDTDI
jgi:hypothetical protein